MVPAGRTEGEVFSLPPCALAQGDIAGCLPEVRGCQAAFAGCVARREPRAQVFGSMGGPFSALERNAIAPMARQVDGGNVRAMPRLISDVVWDEGQRRRTSQRVLHDDLGEAEGVWMLDASGFPNKGRESVGVARQDGGTLGPVENGPVGVFAA